MGTVKCIGILTSGGDAPGMNAAIRAVTRSAIYNGLSVKGIYRGYKGLVTGEIKEFKSQNVSNIIQLGGTILKTARCKEFTTPEGRQIAYDNMKKEGIDALVIIGCDGSLTGDQFITNRTELDTIKQRFPDGLAVDMESAAIAQTCYLYNVPFLSFRIISDTPGGEDHASQYADFWGTMAERSFLTIWTFLSTLPSNL